MRDARLAGSSVTKSVSAMEALARAAWLAAAESVASAARPPANERRVWGMGRALDVATPAFYGDISNILDK
jgi:hypothetical protein